ncbi:MAG: hypothetical protein IJC24_04925 [Clostridia bacterium]|nr:hypothetical protein [Clostridia bacterium]
MVDGSKQGLGSLAMIAVGAVYLMIGMGGIAQWNNRRKRILREKAELKEAAAAVAKAIEE